MYESIYIYYISFRYLWSATLPCITFLQKFLHNTVNLNKYDILMTKIQDTLPSKQILKLYSKFTQRCLINFNTFKIGYAFSLWIENRYITKTQIQVGFSEVTQHVLLSQVSKIMNEIKSLLY